MPRNTTTEEPCPIPDTIFSMHIPVSEFVPNSLRSKVIELYHKIISRYLSSSSTSLQEIALHQLLAIPKLVLRKNGTGETRNRNRPAYRSSLRQRLVSALRGEWTQLFEQARHSHPHRPVMSPSSDNDAKIRRARTAFLKGDLSGASRILHRRTSPIPSTPYNRDLLQSLHPRPSMRVLGKQSQDLPAPLKVSVATLRRFLLRFPYYTAPGPDGMRPGIFRCLAYYPGGNVSTNPFLRDLTKFINLVLDGALPFSARSWFATGNLLGLRQPDSEKVRPLAVGIIWRRLISRIACSVVSKSEHVQKYLAPFQFAVGVPSGSEALIHVVRQVCTSLKHEDYVLLSLDAKNAFNSVERQLLLEQVEAYCPELSRYTYFCYGQDIHLRFGTLRILSSTGTQQGDPLSMLLFALAIHPMILAVQTVCRPVLNLFYADDGYLLIPRSSAQIALNTVIQHGLRPGFTLNLDKTKVWWWRIPTIPRFTAKIHRADSISIMGSPIGYVQACQTSITLTHADRITLMELLPALSDPYMAYQILKFCASACKMIYLIRTTPPHITSAECRNFDMTLRRVFEKIFRPTPSAVWERATLPIRLGGLGIQITTTICYPAYIGSLASTWNNILPLSRSALRRHNRSPTFQQDLTSLFTNISPLPNDLNIQSVLQELNSSGRRVRLQHDLSENIYSNIYERLIPPTSTTALEDRLTRARHLSVCTTESSMPLNMFLPSNTETRLAPTIWNTMVDLRLGAQLFQGRDFCQFCLHDDKPQNEWHILDKYGYHAATCSYGPGSTRRHNSLRDRICTLLRRPPLGLCISREYTISTQNPGNIPQHLRLDILVEDSIFGDRPIGLDLTIVSPHNKKYTVAAATSPGGAADRAEQYKISKYRSACSENNIDFFPIGFDIYGAPGRQAQHFFSMLSQLAAERTGSSPSTVYSKLMGSVQLHLQQLTAHNINRRKLL